MNATRQTLYLRFLSDPEQKIVKPDKNEKSRLYTENFEQSTSFVLIIGASSFMLVWKKNTLPDRKHLFTMHLILSLDFTAREDITDAKKIYQRVKNEA